MRALSGRRTRVRLRELAIVDAPIVGQVKRIHGCRRDCGFDSARLGGREFLHHGVRLALPSRALLQFRTLLRVEREVENARAVVLRIDAALGDKAVYDRFERIARAETELEQRPRLRRPGLRHDHASRPPPPPRSHPPPPQNAPPTPTPAP